MAFDKFAAIRHFRISKISFAIQLHFMLQVNRISFCSLEILQSDMQGIGDISARWDDIKRVIRRHACSTYFPWQNESRGISTSFPSFPSGAAISLDNNLIRLARLRKLFDLVGRCLPPE